VVYSREANQRKRHDFLFVLQVYFLVQAIAESKSNSPYKRRSL
ncbi:unnamed protein product, partial [Heterotrigona itama]